MTAAQSSRTKPTSRAQRRTKARRPASGNGRTNEGLLPKALMISDFHTRREGASGAQLVRHNGTRINTTS